MSFSFYTKGMKGDFDKYLYLEQTKYLNELS